MLLPCYFNFFAIVQIENLYFLYSLFIQRIIPFKGWESCVQLSCCPLHCKIDPIHRAKRGWWKREKAGKRERTEVITEEEKLEEGNKRRKEGKKRRKERKRERKFYLELIEELTSAKVEHFNGLPLCQT